MYKRNREYACLLPEEYSLFQNNAMKPTIKDSMLITSYTFSYVEKDFFD
jgi:hypothetical protein